MRECHRGPGPGALAAVPIKRSSRRILPASLGVDYDGPATLADLRRPSPPCSWVSSPIGLATGYACAVTLYANVSPPEELAEPLVLASYIALSFIGVWQTFGDEGDGEVPLPANKDRKSYAAVATGLIILDLTLRHDLRHRLRGPVERMSDLIPLAG